VREENKYIYLSFYISSRVLQSNQPTRPAAVTFLWSKSSSESTAHSAGGHDPLYMARYPIILVTWLLCLFPLLITGPPYLDISLKKCVWLEWAFCCCQKA